jgi:diacylglycerol kinase family enzyme
MRVLVIYRPNSDHARQVEEYIADFERFHPGETLEVHNIDSVEGAHMAQLYGVMNYPTVLALSSDGTMQQIWSGLDKLPLMNDLAYYVGQ